jgi:hypothetical protein
MSLKIISNAGLNKTEWTATFAVFFIMCGYYLLLLHYRISSDIQPHAAIAHSFVVNADKISPNFLYFFLVALLTGFSKYYNIYYASSIFLIAVSIASKFAITINCLKKYTDNYKGSLYYIAAAIIMLFVFALPGFNFFFITRDFYLGQLVPNVWHNSTVIFLMPFAVLLFLLSYRMFYTNGWSKKDTIWVVVLILLNALIKPSFLFVLLPSVFIITIYRLLFLNYQISSLKKLLPFSLAIILITLEYLLIYKLNYVSEVTAGSTKQSGIIVAPFEVWRSYANNNIFIAIVTSLFFPLLYILLSKGRVMQNKLIQFTSLHFLIGLLVWILFAEEGERKFHGNFYWQIVPAYYLFFLSLVIYFINENRKGMYHRFVQTAIGVAILLHFVWGVFYWAKIIIFRGYN